MAYVYPFVGTRYNLKIVPNLSEIVTPPYDCIGPKLQEILYGRNPRNFVRIELGKEIAGDDEFTNRYSRAASLLQEWKRDQTLIEDPKQSFYLMEQDYAHPDGKRFKRRGFYGLVRLQGYGAGQIRAHEQTFKGPKADRYRLMRATQYNLSPIFVLYKDPHNEVGELMASVMDKSKPGLSVCDDDGTNHSIWIASHKDLLRAISEVMRDRELLIADGHHRFETALHYRNEIRRVSGQKGGRHGSDYMMMYLVSMSDPGLQILPTHRALADEAGVGVDVDEVIEDLKENFKVETVGVDLRKEAEQSARALLNKIEAAGKKGVAMAMVLPGGKACILTLKRGVDPAQLVADRDIPDVVARLDVSILHNYVIPNVWIGNPEIELDEDDVLYSRDAAEMLRMLTCRKASVVFLMNPPQMKQILDVSDKGLRLPHKTTFFYPKIPSGLVMRDMRTIGA